MELFVEIVLIWIDIVEYILDDKECLLSMWYSTTYIGWLHKACKPTPNKHPQLPLAKMRLQRQLIYLIINNKHLLYSQ